LDYRALLEFSWELTITIDDAPVHHITTSTPRVSRTRFLPSDWSRQAHARSASVARAKAVAAAARGGEGGSDGGQPPTAAALVAALLASSSSSGRGTDLRRAVSAAGVAAAASAGGGGGKERHAHGGAGGSGGGGGSSSGAAGPPLDFSGWDRWVASITPPVPPRHGSRPARLPEPEKGSVAASPPSSSSLRGRGGRGGGRGGRGHPAGLRIDGWTPGGGILGGATSSDGGGLSGGKVMLPSGRALALPLVPRPHAATAMGGGGADDGGADYGGTSGRAGDASVTASVSRADVVRFGAAAMEALAPEGPHRRRDRAVGLH